MKLKLQKGLLGLVTICGLAFVANTETQTVQAESVTDENVEYPPLTKAEDSPDKDFDTSETSKQVTTQNTPATQKNRSTSNASVNSRQNITNAQVETRPSTTTQTAPKSNSTAIQSQKANSNSTVKPHAQKVEKQRTQSKKKTASHEQKQKNKRITRHAKNNVIKVNGVIVGSLIIVVIGVAGLIFKKKIF